MSLHGKRKIWFAKGGNDCPLLATSTKLARSRCCPPATPTPMLATTAASLRPPLRRFPSVSSPLGTSHGGASLLPWRRRRSLACRADLQQDAPFAAAIGACVLASLVLPPPRPRGEAVEEVEEEGEFGFGASDTRMAVMGIISFLPYFNWLVSEAQGFSAFALHFFLALVSWNFRSYLVQLELDLCVARQREAPVSGLRCRLLGSVP